VQIGALIIAVLAVLGSRQVCVYPCVCARAVLTTFLSILASLPIECTHTYGIINLVVLLVNADEVEYLVMPTLLLCITVLLLIGILSQHPGLMLPAMIIMVSACELWRSRRLLEITRSRTASNLYCPFAGHENSVLDNYICVVNQLVIKRYAKYGVHIASAISNYEYVVV
jgi:hypothetical protein